MRAGTIIGFGMLLLLGSIWTFLRPEATVPGQHAVASTANTHVHELKLGLNMPEGSALFNAAARFAEQVTRQSQGRLRVRLYPNQELGNDHQMLEQARRGKLDMLLIPSAKLSVAIPEMQYPDLPFYFPTKEDLYAMLDGEPGRLLLADLKRIGLVGVAFWGNGFKDFTANKPLLAPQDFTGLRFRIMKSRLLQQQFRLLGAEAIPIDFHELRQALKDGVVDGQENPLIAIEAMGIDRVQSDLTLSQHAYLAYVFTVSEKSLHRLTPDLQQLITDTARSLTVWERQETERHEAKLLQQITARGVHIHRLSEQQRAAFRRRLNPLVESFRPVIGENLMALSDSLLLQRHSPLGQHAASAAAR